MANGSYFHLNAATTGAIVSPNPAAILQSVYINTASTGASGGVLTIYDGQSTSGKVVAVINTLNGNVPGYTYNAVMPGGIFVTFTAGATTTGDVTIMYQ